MHKNLKLRWLLFRRNLSLKIISHLRTVSQIHVKLCLIGMLECLLALLNTLHIVKKVIISSMFRYIVSNSDVIRSGIYISV